MGTPAWAATPTTSRQASTPSLTASAKYGVVNSVVRSGSSAKASRMRSRNWARMMQPPRQIVAIMPRSTPHPYSSEPATIWSNPWA